MNAIMTLEQQTARYQDELRRQMKAQDRRKFISPDAPSTLDGLWVLYVWRRQTWLLAGFARLKPTPQRVRRWRMRARIADTELMRVVELRIAQKLGAGGPPIIRAVKKKPRRAGRVVLKKNVAPPVVVTKMRVDPTMSRCDYGKGTARTARCTHRAGWHVAYKTLRSVGRPVLKCRCTKHAWNAKFFPPIARDLVRVVRQRRAVK